MELFVQQVLSGLAVGGIYASLALALVMIYQATEHVNFAQGEMAIEGAEAVGRESSLQALIVQGVAGIRP